MFMEGVQNPVEVCATLFLPDGVSPPSSIPVTFIEGSASRSFYYCKHVDLIVQWCSHT